MRSAGPRTSAASSSVASAIRCGFRSSTSPRSARAAAAWRGSTPPARCASARRVRARPPAPPVTGVAGPPDGHRRRRGARLPGHDRRTPTSAGSTSRRRVWRSAPGSRSRSGSASRRPRPGVFALANAQMAAPYGSSRWPRAMTRATSRCWPSAAPGRCTRGRSREELGIARVVVPPFAGVNSAVGLLQADFRSTSAAATARGSATRARGRRRADPRRARGGGARRAARTGPRRGRDRGRALGRHALRRAVLRRPGLLPGRAAPTSTRSPRRSTREHERAYGHAHPTTRSRSPCCARARPRRASASTSTACARAPRPRPANAGARCASAPPITTRWCSRAARWERAGCGPRAAGGDRDHDRRPARGARRRRQRGLRHRPAQRGVRPCLMAPSTRSRRRSSATCSRRSPTRSRSAMIRASYSP